MLRLKLAERGDRQIKGHSEWISLGYLGSTGQTAYSGIYGECDLRKEHTVVVSGAAG